MSEISQKIIEVGKEKREKDGEAEDFREVFSSAGLARLGVGGKVWPAISKAPRISSFRRAIIRGNKSEFKRGNYEGARRYRRVLCVISIACKTLEDRTAAISIVLFLSINFDSSAGARARSPLPRFLLHRKQRVDGASSGSK